MSASYSYNSIVEQIYLELGERKKAFLIPTVSQDFLLKLLKIKITEFASRFSVNCEWKENNNVLNEVNCNK